MAGAFESREQEIACCGSTIYVLWKDIRNGQADIFLNFSTNGGATWQATDIRVDGGDVPGATALDDPRICCDGANAYVAWENDRNTDKDIFFNGSTP